MEKVEVRFDKWIGEGFNLYKENFGVLVVPSLIAMLLSFTGILVGPMMAGMILITFSILDKKEPKPQVSDLFKGFDHFVQTFLFFLVWGIGFGILYLIIIVLMFIPCVGWLLAFCLMIFAVVVMSCLMFAMFLIVDKKMDFWTASMTSFEKVKTNFFPLLGLTLIAGFLGCIGSFLTMPFYYFIMSIAYRDIFGNEPMASQGCCGTCGGTTPTPPAGKA
jgi:MFS family permease